MGTTDKPLGGLSIQIPVDFLIVCDGEYSSAFILWLIRSESQYLDQEWVKCSIKKIEDLSFGSVKNSKAKSSIKKLLLDGLISQVQKTGESSLVKIHQDKIEEILRQKTDPSYAKRVGRNQLTTWVKSTRYLVEIAQVPSRNQLGRPYLYNTSNSNNKRLSESNNQPIGGITPQTVENSTASEEVEVNTDMNSDSTSTVLSAFRKGSAKFKTEQSKRNLGILVSRYGDKIGKVIEEYGEENTLEGIRAFIDDPYWQERDLPIEAFLKFPYQWTKDKDGTVTPYNASKKNPGSRYRKYSAASPASSNAQQTASRIESVVSVGPPPTKDRMRVMRRNEALMLLSACKSLRWQEHKDKFNSDFWQMSDQEIDDIVDMAAAEFKTLTGRECLVVSRPLVKPEKETV